MQVPHKFVVHLLLCPRLLLRIHSATVALLSHLSYYSLLASTAKWKWCDLNVSTTRFLEESGQGYHSSSPFTTTNTAKSLVPILFFTSSLPSILQQQQQQQQQRHSTNNRNNQATNQATNNMKFTYVCIIAAIVTYAIAAPQ